MSPAVEKRALQIAVALVLVLPFTAAIAGIAGGPKFLGRPPVIPTDLDSHFRYVSGLFLAMLLAYVSCIPDIERKTDRLRLLGFLTVVGGLARLGSLVMVGVPSIGHQVGLLIELGIAPAILLWQARVARRFERKPRDAASGGRS
ncbi:hypothetical protein ASE86_12790 [Sphingomonas sp. Leaf33]|uniref:DUF4345 domain-containing protein n=1 Tax=Sphingomonas sp. Leaf33 TaxID=1736215 RepID=UPI0006F7C055|nr:DUF4345 domain-containing protein [Sphingomonas sp. Leaf33]KQN19364.1 hypothetical protein ASE86_12790 [Sphingomonas sp. Leaf33]